jgi:cardiolipin synthase
VGSSNLDFRSFWLNAECNLLCFDAESAQGLERSFTHDLRASVEVTSADWARRSLGHRVMDAAARACRWAL